MDAKNIDVNKIKEIKDFSTINLKTSIDSQRDLLFYINKKVKTFLENKGLNIVLISGLRGTGKTTILKTIAKKYSALYTSGDFLKLKNISLNNISIISRNLNYKIIIIDEILYLDKWQEFLKIEANSNSDILFIVSGSSAMQFKEIGQDLFRRMDIYNLKPLSFREFLKIKHNIIIKEDLKFSLFKEKDKEKIFLKLLDFKESLPEDIFSKYNLYLKSQLPFVLQEENKFSKIYDLVQKIIYKDLPLIDNIYSKHLKDIELIIKFLSTCEKVNYTSISKNVGLKKDLLIKIITLLEKAELIKFIPDLVPTRNLRTNKKILFSSPTIRLSLNQINKDKVIGFAREDMFAFILRSLDLLVAYNYKQDGYDYLVDNIKFEVGSKKKVKKDIFLIGDFLDLKYENKVLYIPFYLFSLLNTRN
jgi:hypothetical protein